MSLEQSVDDFTEEPWTNGIEFNRSRREYKVIISIPNLMDDKGIVIKIGRVSIPETKRIYAKKRQKAFKEAHINIPSVLHLSEIVLPEKLIEAIGPIGSETMVYEHIPGKTLTEFIKVNPMMLPEEDREDLLKERKELIGKTLEQILRIFDKEYGVDMTSGNWIVRDERKDSKGREIYYIDSLNEDISPILNNPDSLIFGIKWTLIQPAFLQMGRDAVKQAEKQIWKEYSEPVMQELMAVEFPPAHVKRLYLNFIEKGLIENPYDRSYR
ncbi:MAG: hypothetical protein ACXAEU_23935 [Candidatus Hodarchaeales archaeon]|jgi:hypothetical protein